MDITESTEVALESFGVVNETDRPDHQNGAAGMALERGFVALLRWLVSEVSGASRWSCARCAKH